MIADVLFVTWDGGGNTPPAVGIADELLSRGHRVRFLGHQRQGPEFESRGFGFTPYRAGRAFSSIAANSPATVISLFSTPSFGRDLLAEVDRKPADLVVIDCLLLSALRAAERAGLRHAALVHLFYGYLRGSWSRGPVGLLARLRGYRPAHSWSAADLTLVATLRELDSVGRRGLPSNVRYTGPVLKTPAIPARDADDPAILVPGRRRRTARRQGHPTRPAEGDDRRIAGGRPAPAGGVAARPADPRKQWHGNGRRRARVAAPTPGHDLRRRSPLGRPRSGAGYRPFRATTGRNRRNRYLRVRRRVSNDLVTVPDPVPPMLATLGTLPTGGGWAYEYKWDGVRAVVYVQGDDVRILSRNERDVTAAYPDIADAARGRGTMILDGEIVAPDAHGRPSFGRLQRRMNVHQPSPSLISGTPLHYNVFDLLSLDGTSLLAAPYTERRARLESQPGLEVPPSFVADSPDSVVADSRRLGLEGVVAKRLDSPYLPGRRSPDWIKAPFIRTQEVVILGFKEGQGRRAGTIGALLVGLYRSGKLSFAGGVGTGFTDAALHALHSQLTPLITSAPAADDIPRHDARGATWVEPTVVGEVEYRSFTEDGRLRHSSWRGLRPDRRPEEAKL